MSTQSSVVYLEIQDVLDRYSWGIPLSSLSCLEKDYRSQFKKSLDYNNNSSGVNYIEELLVNMRNDGMVLFLPESEKTYVMSARTVKTRQEVLKRDVQELLDEYDGGIPLMSFERVYKDKFKVKLDYHFFGLKDNLELFDAMHTKGMVLFYEKPECKEKYVMSVCQVDCRREILKLNVQELLGEHGGEIPVKYLEGMYKDKFMVKLDYHLYYLKDFDHLCEVLNLVVEGANLREEVKNEGKIYNLRKTKITDGTNMSMQSSVVYLEVQEVLGLYLKGLSMLHLSCLKTDYQVMFRRPLNYEFLGVKDIKELVDAMHTKGMVLFYENPESNEKYVMCARTVKTRHEVLKRDVQELLDEYDGGIPLMFFESVYEDKFKVKLDYHFFGSKDIEELFDVMHTKGMVLFYENPESKEKYVMSVRQVDCRREILKRNFQELLGEYGGKIPVRYFEGMYKDKFMVKLDYHLCCLKDFDHLCEVLNLVVDGANLRQEVEMEDTIYNLRKRNITYGTNMSMQSSIVYLEIQKTLGFYVYGLPMLHLSCLKTDYQLKFKRPLNYEFLGVKDIKELIDAMHAEGMVLFYENPKSKKKHVMCARAVKTRHEVLKRDVQELLDESDGGIPLMSFESLYKEKFKVKLDYEFLVVKDIKEIIDAMHTEGMVLFYENPESTEKYVMSVRQVAFRRAILKRNVQELLGEHGGEIPVRYFEGMYKDKFMVKLDYHLCCLKDFDHLCEVLNLVVDGANLREELKKEARSTI